MGHTKWPLYHRWHFQVNIVVLNWIKFNWNLVPWDHFSRRQNCSRWWLGAEWTTSHYLNQLWHGWLRSIVEIKQLVVYIAFESPLSNRWLKGPPCQVRIHDAFSRMKLFEARQFHQNIGYGLGLCPLLNKIHDVTWRYWATARWIPCLTKGRDKIAASSQATFASTLPWMIFIQAWNKISLRYVH